jgi:predicted acylesterase/phospholipase RssA
VSADNIRNKNLSTSLNKQINDVRMYSIMEINIHKQEEEKQKELPVETVLILQGGGSLGAYECGVYKTLAKHKIKFDIVLGTSIGALNAAIIASHNYESMKSSTKELKFLVRTLRNSYTLTTTIFIIILYR